MICIEEALTALCGGHKCGCRKCVSIRTGNDLHMCYRRNGISPLAPYTQAQSYIMYQRMQNYTEKLKAMPKLTAEQYKAIEQILDYRLALVTFDNQKVDTAVDAALRDLKTLAPPKPLLQQYLGGKRFVPSVKKIPRPAPGDGRFSL